MKELTDYIVAARNSGMTPQQIAGALLNAGWRMEHLVAVLTAEQSAYRAAEDPGIIIASELRKSFGQIEALRGVSISIQKGKIVALLGPNGAGKTTLVRILSTLSKPDYGNATVANYDVIKDGQEVRRLIGLTGQFAAVDGILTGRENLEMVGRLYHLTPQESKERAEELLGKFSLTEAADRPAKTYSGGMRRRLDVAASLVNKPKVLFLDEPTTGLDPQSRLALWKIIRDLAESGTTIMLTTQYLEEADHLANSIIVIDHGRIIAEGTANELKAKIGGDMIEIHFSDHGQIESGLKVIKTLTQENIHTDYETGMIRVPTSKGSAALVAALRSLDNSGIKIADIALRRPTLDDVFLSLTGHRAEN